MMLKKLDLNSEKGFTLVELMIVVAIIGILAAVAIPNFVAYRNKAFCTSVESDANSIASAIADYFARPDHTALVTADIVVTTSNGNTYTIGAGSPNTAITISVSDGSGRCPSDYQASTASWTGGDYTKVIQQ